VISFASVAGTPVHAQVQAETILDEYDVTAPTLGYGDTGETVADVQTFLQNQGYNPGEVDGVYGSRTGTAVREFQEDQGLFADGIVGRQTWNAMLNFEAATENTFIERESDFESETDLDSVVE
jgi:peptidoglycan hydrolase-like protein with peptidoglycan-binding domain